MPARRRALTSVLLCCAAVLAGVLPIDAAARGLQALGGIDSKQRLWLAAFGGLSLGVAFGLIAFELRSRALSVAIRRLVDLIIGMDGRFPDDSRRKAPAVELQRLSDELMFAAQRAARDRRETEHKMANWEAIFAAALDAMFTLDGAGRITAINPAAERLFRIKADESVGKPLSDVMLPPTHRSPDNAAFANDLATGKAQGRTQELVAQRGDGRQFPVEVSIGEFGSDERRGFVVIARDISQVRRGRAELSRMREHMTSTENQLRAELDAIKKEQVQAATIAAATPVQLEPEMPRAVGFTVEEVCGEPLRKLAARAERRQLGFRYEDSELQGLLLLGDAGRLRRVLIELIDSTVRTASGGEIVVHLTTVAGEGRHVDLMARVTATAMTEAEALRTVKPFISETVTRSEALPYPGRADIHRAIDVLGTRVTMKTAVGGGASFVFQLPFEADLSQVAIDLSALPVSTPAPRRQPGPRKDLVNDPARLPHEFAKSAARLRKHAEKPNLIALWAEAHRLKDIWQRHGGRDDIGLVSALSHTARGGDATNAILLARRLADALDAAAQVSHRPPTVGA
jgi:PAS domain S-box-containing protein